MLRQLQATNTTGNATVPATCAKDSDCTVVANYTKGCCMKYDPGAADATVLASLTTLGYPAAAGKGCATDTLKA
jgi:hypothetical protein